MKNLLILFSFLFIACRDKEEVIASNPCDFKNLQKLYSISNAKYKVKSYLSQNLTNVILVALDTTKAGNEAYRSAVKFDDPDINVSMFPQWPQDDIVVCNGALPGFENGSNVIVSGILYLKPEVAPKIFSNIKVKINPNEPIGTVCLSGGTLVFKITFIEKME